MIKSISVKQIYKSNKIICIITYMHLNLLFDYVYGFEQILSFCLYLTLTGHCVPQGQRDYAMVLLHLTEPFFFFLLLLLLRLYNKRSLENLPYARTFTCRKEKKKKNRNFFLLLLLFSCSLVGTHVCIPGNNDETIMLLNNNNTCIQAGHKYYKMNSSC